MRVDIEIDYETLRWAAIQAASLGISRRKFLLNCIEKVKNHGPNIQFITVDKDYIPQHIGRSSTITPLDVLPYITSLDQPDNTGKTLNLQTNSYNAEYIRTIDGYFKRSTGVMEQMKSENILPHDTDEAIRKGCEDFEKNTETSLHILPLPATEDEELAKDELIRKHPFYKIVYDRLEELFQEELDKERSQLHYEELPQKVKNIIDQLGEEKEEFRNNPSLGNPNYVPPPIDEIGYIFNPHSTPEELQEKLNKEEDGKVN